MDLGKNKNISGDIQKNNLFTSFFKNEENKKISKEFLYSIVNIFFDEIYPYIWFLCIYHVVLIFITLANLFLLIRYYITITEKKICLV